MTKTFYLTTLFAVTFLCLAASAQNQPAEKKSTGAAAMSMPKPAAEMKDLRDLVGTWSTDGQFEPSPMMPSGGSATGTNTVRLGPGGFTILMELRSKSAMGPFAAHGVLTWDPSASAYKFVFAESMMPGVVIFTGHKEGETLVFTHETTMMGKKTTIKQVLSDRMPASYTVTSYMNDGSGEKKTMTVKYTKQESAAPKK